MFWNPESAQVESGIQHLESGIYSLGETRTRLVIEKGDN